MSGCWEESTLDNSSTTEGYQLWSHWSALLVQSKSAGVQILIGKPSKASKMLSSVHKGNQRNRFIGERVLLQKLSVKDQRMSDAQICM